MDAKSAAWGHPAKCLRIRACLSVQGGTARRVRAVDTGLSTGLETGSATLQGSKAAQVRGGGRAVAGRAVCMAVFWLLWRNPGGKRVGAARTSLLRKVAARPQKRCRPWAGDEDGFERYLGEE